MRLSRWILLLSAGGAAALASPPRPDVGASHAARPQHRAAQAIVKFEPATAFSTVWRTVHDAGGLSARRGRSGTHFLVDLDPGVPLSGALAQLERRPGVAYAEPNGIVRAHRASVPAVFRPNDSLFFRQWHLKMLHAERAWGIRRADRSVVVAVVDTGVAFEDYGPFRKAPDWGGTVFVPGLNVFTGDAHANDDDYHGTHVASIIAEGTNNAEGAAGLAFGCAIMPIKVLDENGEGNFFDVADAVFYAYRDAPVKAKVINLSLGGSAPSATLSEAIDAAVAAGTVIVASSGNENVAEVAFPASHPKVIGVGAVDTLRRRAEYSNHGPELDVVAPGGDTKRDDDGDGVADGILQQSLDRDAADAGIYDRFVYQHLSGTSQAAPLVSATAALLVGQGITSPAAVRSALQATAEDLGPPGHDNQYGHGLIRPVQALSGYGLNH